MSRTDFEAAYIERYGHRPRGWSDDFQVYQDAHANGAWFGWQAGAAGIEAKAAPVGELREAFEEWREESGQYVKSPVVFEAFQAGAAYQRQSGVVVPHDLLMRVLEPITSEGYINSKHELLSLMREFARLNGAGSHE